MEYRRELDGLRAVAVVSTILFHAGINLFQGGFVGVDIFFVISGYLITTIILSDIESGNFSITKFYERRARRILPALFIVMLISIVFAWLWLPPREMKSFSESLFAVSVFLSNHLFLSEAGYFATAVELKPMLHTWSLAIEEQYYLLFPLFLTLFWSKGKRWLFTVIALTCITSLAVSQWAVHAEPEAAFYVLPARAWELMLGAIAAFYLARSDREHFDRRVSETCGWLGIALILYAIFTYSKSTPFPGFYALTPTLGTLLLILFSSNKNTIGKLLGNPIFVGVGLVSYSAYLWHQPLFAFTRQRSLHEPPVEVFGALFLLTFLLAYLSWKYIESPFRSRTSIKNGMVFSFAGLGTLFFISFGLYGHLTNGILIGRSNHFATQDFDDRFKPNWGLGRACASDPGDYSRCDTSTQPEVLLWGDSYAMHLAQGFLASNPEIRIAQRAISTCGPFLGISPIHSNYTRLKAERCIAFNDRVYAYLRGAQSIKYVVLSSPFGQYVNDGETILTRGGNIEPGRVHAIPAMRETIEKIKALGKIPVVVSPPPLDGSNIGECLRKASYYKEALSSCDIRYSDVVRHQSKVFDFLQNISNYAPVINITEALCHDDVCRTSVDGLLIYRDNGHLTPEGSSHLGKKIGLYNRLLEAGGGSDPSLKGDH